MSNLKSYAQIEIELAEAIEEIRWLREAITPPKDFRFAIFRLSVAESIILYALATTPKGFLKNEQLRRRVDSVLNRYDETDPNTIKVFIYRLRNKLAKTFPPIMIKNHYGFGYSLNDENKNTVLSFLVEPHGVTS